MNVTPADLPGVLVIEPRMFEDDRGRFLESFQARRYRDEAGIELLFVQDNVSRSHHGVLRGLHAQRTHPQGKLVQVIRGEIFDVAADIDPASPSFGRWSGTLLSDADARQLWIPPGYAHGFLVLSEVADVVYKCTDYYRADDEVGVIWNDADLAIEWPIIDPLVSAKDRALPTLAQLRKRT